MSQVHPIVRAIDVGYGNTKFVAFHDWDQAPVCDSFPSIATVSNEDHDYGSGVASRRDTVVVSAGEGMYEVGKASDDSNRGTRLLDPSYPRTENYLALIRGAMYYMGVDHIDLLIVGLPVDTHLQYKDFLPERLRGTHPIPESGRPSHTRMVEVKEVKVFPQPMGTFLNYAVTQNLVGQLKASGAVNLVIDPGFFTLDWLKTKGFGVISENCGAYHGGMARILESIAKRISAKIGSSIPNLSGIDRGLRNGSNIAQFRGNDFDFSEYVPQAKLLAKEAVHVLASKVGNTLDIQKVILAGGGSFFFEDAVREKFDGHTVITLGDPMFGNVVGFQLIGVDSKKAKLAAARAAA